MKVAAPISSWIARVMLALVTALLAAPLLASAALEPATLTISAPATAGLGDTIVIQARLVDRAGSPVSKATIVFASTTSFLGSTGNVEIDRVVTDGQGKAETSWEVRRNGTVGVRADFAGNDKLAAAQATAEMAVQGSAQLYTQPEPAGVQIPLLAAVVPAPILSALAGWPIALALGIVWSLYTFTVVLIGRIATDVPQPADVQEAAEVARARRAGLASQSLVQMASAPQGTTRRGGSSQ